ncbi:hemophore-related protein [Micromonospora sp. WMMD736]|uniref:hemophore-related protein n=1 Tax=Micromonospora sp. WMMD736 TaxID=3404112 RepID=UPI003B95A7A5
MMKLSRAKLALAFGGLAVAVPCSVGIASAQPDLSGVVNTTCSYDQVIAALNAHDPAFAQDFTATPMATATLRNFLAAPISQRQQTAEQLASYPAAAQYLGTMNAVAGSCNNF